MSKNKTKDIFDDDFEVVYQEDYSELLRDAADGEEEDDDYEDVLSTLSELDENVKNTDKNRRRKRRKAPNLVSPAAKTLKTGGKIVYKFVNILLRAATLILTAVIFCLLAEYFWKNHSAYGDVFRAFIDKNYILVAYTGIAIFLLLFEFFTFLLVITGSKKHDHKDCLIDTGRGLFSFIFIYAGSFLSYLFNGFIPSSPAFLQGVRGALNVYGSIHTLLLPLCIAGIISCLIRKFFVR
ncbi:hypothetical protein IMSAGC018_00125 [Lachnospiraceae bacterium]|nr:hypothetical protein IMSAGC018_00125 [Lachnospiraceae bacterium]